VLRHIRVFAGSVDAASIAFTPPQEADAGVATPGYSRVAWQPGRSARRPAHSGLLVRVCELRSVVPLEAKLIPIGSRGARHGFPPVGEEIGS
jgi:hypothetical protein